MALSESERASFYYRDLQHSRREIRLLTIYPAEDLLDPIRALVSTVSLDDNPVYDALSYVWGDESNRATITLHETGFDDICEMEATVSVTANLETALRYVRASHQRNTSGCERPCVIWADAICINQINLPEKNSQVAMMGAIYENCVMCLAWIGCPEIKDNGDSGDENIYEDEDYQAFELLEQLQSGHIYDEKCTPDSPCNGKGGGMVAISRLLQRQWFERAWTFQESVLPRGVMVWMYGTRQLDVKVFRKANDNIILHHLELLCCSSPTWCRDCKHGLDYLQTNMTTFMASRRVSPRPGHAEWRLLTMLTLTRLRKSKDPLDKVYSLLSVVPASQTSGIIVDYATSAKDLYTLVLLEDIRLYNSFCGLHAATYNGPSSLILPSWLPDWSSYSQTSSYGLSIGFYHLYDASSARSPQFDLILNNTVMQLNSFNFQEVCDIGTALQMKVVVRSEMGIIIKQWLSLIEDMKPQSLEYIAGGTKRSAFWRTVTNDICIDFENATPLRTGEGDEAIFWKCIELFIHNQDLTDESLAVRMRDAISGLASTLGQRFFITKAGYFGTGPVNLKVHDQIHVVKGGHKPLVLRSITDPSRHSGLANVADSSSLYSLVGDCYLHGIMDGEVGTRLEQGSEAIFIV